MRRAYIVFGCIAILYSVIVTRLFYWQIIRGRELRIEAMSQYFAQFILPAQRGQILASDGKPLVMNQPAYLAYAQPRLISDKDQFIRDVSAQLHIDPSDISESMKDPSRVWMPLQHRVDKTVVDELKTRNIKGLGFEKEPKRYYPEASVAAQLFGFVGYDSEGRDKGYFGLEGYYDRELRGKDGTLQLEKDVRGAPILIADSERIEPENGRSLELWVDRTVQRLVDMRLTQGIVKYGAKAGSIIVLDPTTGGVLATSSFPSYDPSSYTTFDKELYQNPVVAASYEPGSTFKSLIMSAALNEKLVTPETTMDEKGSVAIGEYAIKTWNEQYHGTISMTQVLEYSSNVGMVFVGRKLGKDLLIRYIKDFGFGEATLIDLDGEASPALREQSAWSEVDLATTSFGQGIAVTPIQMVRAVGALANDGWLMEPRVVAAIVDGEGKRHEIKPKRLRQVVSSATSRVISEMMIAAVDNGEAKWAKPKGYRIAGKTGTAQIPVAGHYDKDKTIASFVGFAPADKPKFVMLVTLREPTSSPWGSETAAPLFFTIARDLFAYYNIPPQ